MLSQRMSKTIWLAFLGGLLGVSAFSGPVVEYEVQSRGGNAYSYTYFLTNISFQANQELDIRFDPNSYSNLSNAMAGSGLQTLLLQPNNPPGTWGDFSIYTFTPVLSPTGNFSVDFIYTGAGQPGAQPFFMNFYNTSGDQLSSNSMGFTTPRGSASEVPEPGSFCLAAGGLLSVALIGRRRFGRLGR